MMRENKQNQKRMFKQVSQKRLKQERDKLVGLSTYLDRYVAKTFNKLNSNPFALGLFSEGGVLLDLYPRDPECLNILFGEDIQVTDIWQDVGYNAVTEGLTVLRSRSSIGEEHESEVLKKYAVYFSIIHMLSIYEPYDTETQCGIAIITPIVNAWDVYFAMVVGISHDLMLNMQFKNIATMYYERSGKGLLTVDNLIAEKILITYYNDDLFKLIGEEPEDIYCKPVETLIDPLPANRVFWDIVANYKKISNFPVKLTVHGKTIDCIASTDVYNQPSIKSGGVSFYFTTQQKMSAEVSQMVANGAIKTFDDLIGEDKELKRMIERAKRMAATDSNVMILGESGTGKDVFAQAIHNASARRDKPFIALNCSAIPRDLIESELFGYESGAFTGARKNGNMGKFELAMGGTIFLDEIGEMPLDLQAKLLRVVEQKQLMRLGGYRLIDVDVKIIAATNVDINEMITEKRFRADLFYRLSTMRLNLLPLRERREDIVLLSEFFIKKVSKRIGREHNMRISPEAKELLMLLDWPGNVRELQNLIECIVQLYPDDMICPQFILENLVSSHKRPSVEIPKPLMRKMHVKPQSLTREDILAAIKECGYNRMNAAEYLGISRRTLYRKLNEFNILE